MNNTWISLIRGINIGGKNLIKMDRLKEIYSDIGYSNPVSYIQSGNIVFSSPDTSGREISDTIKKALFREAELSVEVFNLTAANLEHIIINQPIEDSSEDRLYVTFIDMRLTSQQEEKIRNACSEKEVVKFSDNAVYLYLPDGYGRTKLNNTLIEKISGGNATTRNWKTLSKLLEIAETYTA